MAENILTLKIFKNLFQILQALIHWSMQLDFPGFNNDARIAGTYLYFLVGERRCKSCASFPRGFKLQIGYFLELHFYAANDKYALEI